MTKQTSSKRVAPARLKASALPARETRATAKALASPKLRNAIKAHATGKAASSKRPPRRGVAESPLMIVSSPTRIALPAVVIAGVRRSSRPGSSQKRFTAQEKGKGRVITLPNISKALDTAPATMTPPPAESTGEENDGDWEFEDGERGYNQEEDAYREAAARAAARAKREANRRAQQTNSAAKRRSMHASEPSAAMEEHDEEWEDEDDNVDDGSDSGLEQDTSHSYIDPDSTTRILKPPTRFALNTPRSPPIYVHGNSIPGTSPIVASIERQQVRKRKRVEFASGDEGHPEDVDVLHRHRQKQRRQGQTGPISTPHPHHRRRSLDLHTPQPAANVLEQATFQTPETPGPRHQLKKHRVKTANAKPWQLRFYTPHTQVVLGCAKDFYRISVLTFDAYPVDKARGILGRAAFDYACGYQLVDYNLSSSRDFDSQKLRVIGDVAWGFRGLCKSRAQGQVVEGCDLKPPRDQEARGLMNRGNYRKYCREFTKARVVTLLQNGKYLNGNVGARTNVKYANRSISTLIRTIVGSLYVTRREVFEPLPIPLVALAAVCVEASIEEYRTGTFIQCNLTAADEGRYRRHVRRLERLRDSMPKRCQKLLKWIAEDAFFDDDVFDVAAASDNEDDIPMFGDDSEDDLE